MPKITKVLLIAVIVLAAATPVVTYSYIHFLKDPAPQRLGFATTSTSIGATNTTSATPSTLPTQLDGTWTVTDASQVGYRVNEILFGQHTEAVGRTGQVSGSLLYGGGQIRSASLTVDMTSLKSDQSNRDNQFRTRIMSTDAYPTASFSLTEAVSVASRPSSAPETINVVGNLTMRGVTKSVATALQIRANGDVIEATGSIPITFSEWQIPNPSFGPAETEDHGELELLVSFRHA